jgi:phage tail-like protein
VTAITATFRLLDGLTGWDPRPSDGLVGVRIVDGSLTLAALRGTKVSTEGRLPDLLTWDGDECSWWIGGTLGVRRLGPCDTDFVKWGTGRSVRALAAGHGLVVMLLAQGPGIVEIRDARTASIVGESRVEGAVGVGLTSDGVAVVSGGGRLTSLDRSGLVCSVVDTCVPADQALPRPVVPGLRSGPAGFCLPDRGCFDWLGQAVPSIADEPTIHLEAGGTYRSVALDSGLPGCRWHRIRIDAEIPPETEVRVSVATTDGSPEGHEPHPSDWFDVGAGVLDTMLRTPPGRWAYVRVDLRGDGRRAPTLHRIRLDLPRHGGLDDLPAIYSEEPRARDFSERFLAVFDAWLEQVDTTLSRRHALLDADALPDDALGWLASLIGIGFEAEMLPERRRALLGAAPDLYRRRGTPTGLLDTLRVALGISAVVEERGTRRPWGAVGSARLGGVRLFGRSTARVHLGTSRLGRAQLRSGGDPDLDAVRAGAHRVVVHLPAADSAGHRVDTALVSRVVRSQTPAHIATTVAVARIGSGLIAGLARVGVDTTLAAPDPAVVGHIGLGRHGVVASGRARGLALVGRQIVGTTLYPRHRSEGTPCP